MGHGLLAFTVVALVLVITPGPDFAVVLPHALESRRAGIATACGTASGLALHAAVAAVGLSAVVLASAEVFTAVKLVGAAFLAVLGIRALWGSRRAAGPGAVTGGDRAQETGRSASARPLTSRRAYQRGFGVNILNPKVPIIYLSVMPQFLDPRAATTPQLLAMAAVLVGLALGWYLLLTVLVQPVKHVVVRFRHWIDRVTGTVLIGLGIRLALEHRPV
ncbi:lysine transporter LysE [Actinomycetota bacterium]|nr:lysine transporter LysE [Actinomycetota bacterium]